MSDDEPLRPATTAAKPVIDRLGVSELQAYIASLRQEIARAEQEIARKQDHRSAADDVFRKQQGGAGLNPAPPILAQCQPGPG